RARFPGAACAPRDLQRTVCDEPDQISCRALRRHHAASPREDDACDDLGAADPRNEAIELRQLLGPLRERARAPFEAGRLLRPQARDAVEEPLGVVTG